MPNQNLPEVEDIREVLHGLLGRDITAAKVAPSGMKIDDRLVVGLYEREDGKVGGLVIAELAVAAYSGAALSLLPVGVANESIEDGTIEDSLLENFQEVLNVGVRWFTAKGNPRVVLSEVYPPGARLPDDVRRTMAAPADRLEVLIEVAGYGEGRMRLFVNPF